MKTQQKTVSEIGTARIIHTVYYLFYVAKEACNTLPCLSFFSVIPGGASEPFLEFFIKIGSVPAA